MNILGMVDFSNSMKILAEVRNQSHLCITTETVFLKATKVTKTHAHMMRIENDDMSEAFQILRTYNAKNILQQIQLQLT